MGARSITTKNISLLSQLYKEGQLNLAPEFQRNSIWPAAAKAYLIDTVLNDRPIPLFFFQRATTTTTGRVGYTVIDGQQRLRAMFDFLDGRFRLSQSPGTPFSNKYFADLPAELKQRIYEYDIIVEELTGYSAEDINDMFVRMNRYVVKLSLQEIRHAKQHGKFRDFVEALGALDFWREERVFSQLQMHRMRSVEFAAELTILLIEGPQDKKSPIDLYYGNYQKSFPPGTEIESRINKYFAWIKRALPSFSESRFRRPVDLYSLIGALDVVSKEGKRLAQLDVTRAGALLIAFEAKTRAATPSGDPGRYVVASSQQTDNIKPRTTRIEVLSEVLSAAVL
jgi:hypothetical protein